MIIANPIYDVVFKYLLEDIEIARELLTTILGVQIIGLEVKPQETLVVGEGGEIKIFHLDFKAVVDLGEGKQKTVLIELQKAKQAHDILRFRKYLGDNYRKEEVRKKAKGGFESYALEIVTIYLLGFKLEGVEVAVLKVLRKYENAITGEVAVATNEFISHLTHESFIIQIPRLENAQRNQLEEVLEVFNQDNIKDDLHILNFKEDSKNPLLKKIIKRLSKAAASEEIKRAMDAEDSIDRILNRELEEKLREQAEAYEEKLKVVEQESQEKEAKLQEKEREMEALRKQLEDALKKLKK
jgi:hypothetical protein